ncbi:N-formylglutamate amidohydrolase [Gluconobacter cerevisiae]|uniref:N-formylglutamate amidohydrolase n=1 Tax=Gluconobacter cerevisiae TaxID=1379734 RepID=A0ABR9YF56_9PROT|nr:N-formylglutamate amidohydrolase [Gluconobacter cerevisiae]MBF0877296.1 N-formylglutamate amidohydrolase [Gluconobacter cerevisiae]
MEILSPLRSFKIGYPRNTAIPLVISSPHSGRYYPPDFLNTAALPLHELQRSEDRFMDQLMEDAPDFGATLLSAEFSRSWCDVNRDWREVDPEMFKQKIPKNDFISTEKVKSGFGVIPRCISQGKKIYSNLLETSEIMKRISMSWLPYHEALSMILNEIQLHFGYVILLEMHSMPKLPYAHSCDIVLGDIHGKSCGPEISDEIENILKRKSYSIRRNTPYSGGYITQCYGRPDKKIHAIQLEICRSLYLNAATLNPGNGFEKTKLNMKNLISDFSNWISKENESIRFL